MYHLVARGSRRTLLWRTWSEGRALWDRLSRALPGLRGLVLMPDHVHLVHPDDVRWHLSRALSGFIRWRSHHRGQPGVGIEPVPPAEPLVDRQKRRRALRYLHLNPCRGRLCADPLAWPLSTHRDACGLSWVPVVRPRPDAVAFHRYVSSDPHVRVDGTDLPCDPVGAPTPDQVLDAVSALARVPVERMRRRGAARSLYLAAATALVQGATTADIASRVAVDPSRVRRARAPAPSIQLVRRVLGDPRFAALDDVELTRVPAFRAYIERKRLRTRLVP